jgi:hypothetical protein
MLSFLTIKMACDFSKLVSAEPRQIDQFCKLVTNFFCVDDVGELGNKMSMRLSSNIEDVRQTFKIHWTILQVIS